MNIKKISSALTAGSFVVIASLTLATSSAIVADDSSQGKMIEKKMEVRSASAMDKISLSDEQKLSVQAIKDTYQPQLDALHESKKALQDQKAALDPNSPDYQEQSQVLDTQIQQISADKKVLKKQMQDETLQVLTPEQRATLGK